MIPKLQEKIDQFLAAHPQHDILVTLTSREAQERGSGAVKVHLTCHNGDCWMGMGASGEMDSLPFLFEGLLNDYAKLRPDHMGDALTRKDRP